MNCKFITTAFLLFSFACVEAQIPGGTVLSFDGNDWVDIGDRDKLEFGLNDFTISAWFKTDFENRDQILIRKGLDNRTPGESRWVLGIHNTNVIRITVDDVDNSVGTTLGVLGSTIVADSNWHHVAAVFDRDASLNVYIDGNLEIADPGLVDQSGMISNSIPIDVYLGRDNGGNEISFFHGSLDEMRIWNTVRTQQQIQLTMNDTLGPEYYAWADSGLIAYWRFDEGVGGEVITDLSVSDNNGLVIGPEFSSVVTAIPQTRDPVPIVDYTLHQNFPNPFNPNTQIGYRIGQNSYVKLTIYNLLGQEVKVLVNQQQVAGSYSANWNATNESNVPVPSGQYYYEIEVNNTTTAKKMLVLK